MQKQIRKIFVGGALVASFLTSLTAFEAHANAAKPKKEWTMLVFINGHNSLDSFGAFNINQMEKVGSSSNLNIVVQWASLKAKTTKRLLVQKDSDEKKVTSPVVQDLPPVDMGDMNSLVDFIKWGADNYPARHYFVVVWNHGSGWHFQSRSLGIRDISSDDRTGHIITTEQLGQAMGEASAYLGQKIDVYGSDACLMGMVEVAQEMAGSVNTFVGSQELEPGDGWPYDRFLTKWAANPMADSNTVGRMLVDAYHDYYVAQKGDQTTLSAIDVRKLPGLLKDLSDLSLKLGMVTDLKAMQTAASNATRFYYDDYVDIGELIGQLTTQLNKTGEAAAELSRVNSSLSQVVVNNQTTNMNAQGLSVWWPKSGTQWTTYKTRYAGLKFDQETQWSNLFNKLF